MKKTVLFVLVISIFFCSSSCMKQEEKTERIQQTLSNCEEEPERIQLTLSNYKDYIAFNITFGEFQFIGSETNPNNTKTFTYTCNMFVTTYASRPNIQFENVTIKYDFGVLGDNGLLVDANGLPYLWGISADFITYNQKTMLSCDGYSTATFYRTSHETSVLEIDLPMMPCTYLPSDDILESISGYVIVY